MLMTKQGRKRHVSVTNYNQMPECDLQCWRHKMHLNDIKCMLVPILHLTLISPLRLLHPNPNSTLTPIQPLP